MNPTDEELAPADGMLKIALERMARSFPFHARFIAAGRFDADSTIGSMGVTVRSAALRFVYSPRFVWGCTFEELEDVLRHLVDHLVLGPSLVVPNVPPEHRSLTIAQPTVCEDGAMQPQHGDSLVLARPPVPSAGEYMDSRHPQRGRNRGKGANDSSALGSISAPSGRNPDLPSCFSGPVAPKSGVIGAKEPGMRAESRAADSLERMVIRVAVRESRDQLTPDQWADLPEELRVGIDRLCQGGRAGSRVEAIEAGRYGTTDWRQILRRCVRQAVEVRPTFNRPDRRLLHLTGIVPGKIRRPGRAKVLAVIDTSDSIDVETLGRIGAELECMCRSHEVLVAECDTEIRACYPFSGPIRTVRGRGGTDLRPPLHPAFLVKIRPDVVVFFTDGGGPAPEHPPRMPMIWALVPGGVPSVPWGRVIRIAEPRPSLP
jgi:hypothetical protein